MALAVALFVPLGSRVLLKTEPYPAVLFPGAGGKLSIVDGKAMVPYLTLYARDADGGLTKLDASVILRPMPPHYLPSVVGNEFGQNIEPFKQWTGAKNRLTITIPRHVPSDENRRLALDWVAERVRDQHASATQLLIRFCLGQFDLARGQETSSTVTDEKTYVLP